MNIRHRLVHAVRPSISHHRFAARLLVALRVLCLVVCSLSAVSGYAQRLELASDVSPAAPDGEVARMMLGFRRLVTHAVSADPMMLAALQSAAQSTFEREGRGWPVGQLLVVVDRHPKVQLLVVALAQADGGWLVVGAAKVSTGRPGEFDHYFTPTGLYEHGPNVGSFRAEGTFNSNHIRGYGLKGMRIFDLGWVQAAKAWGPGGLNIIRLQIHATDPVLEARLGRPASKGCIRIDAGLNRFLDEYGVLDGAFEQWHVETGQHPWFWLTERRPTPWSGRWVVIVDVAPIIAVVRQP
ncbi:MAG: L,D-transpeptidase [Aquabacterium sp.]|uniref:L,D-transpeptidase n=1 Tax=Aquabacterium sp. TaxID=1872578 RepID=UPI003BBC04FC